ncbi:MAG: hypothetical protein AVDCRST_MAG47-1347 [uncultured Nocardioidaceae bacterium]|uniref:Uncharacterized protein n=1 Tax=uncultured Nocardioidaceae bacterium TaxID=253824 RepID=A0A6J4MYE0_9ACTN|nr:MAG: hypothetical protein AVDCRST_MAG47-1347 [uncultured Nocardioidaceae bacterium]
MAGLVLLSTLVGVVLGGYGQRGRLDGHRTRSHHSL